MTTVVGQLKNRYLRNGPWWYRRLSEYVARPLSVFLLAVFLLGHAVAVSAELQSGIGSAQAKGATEIASDIHCDLHAEATNGRELRCGRESTENYSTPKLELKSHHRQTITCAPLALPKRQFVSYGPFLYSVSFCDAPFSPRPPPVASLLQG